MKFIKFAVGSAVLAVTLLGLAGVKDTQPAKWSLSLIAGLCGWAYAKRGDE